MEVLLRKYAAFLESNDEPGIANVVGKVKANIGLYQSIGRDIDEIERHLIDMLRDLPPINLISIIGLLRIAGLKNMISYSIKIEQFHVDYITSFALKVCQFKESYSAQMNEDVISKIVKLTTLLVMFKTHDLHKKTMTGKNINGYYRFIRMREFSIDKIETLRELVSYYDETIKKNSGIKNLLEFVIRIVEEIYNRVESIGEGPFDMNDSFQFFLFNFDRLKVLYDDSASNEQFADVLDLYTVQVNDFENIDFSEIILHNKMEEKFLIKLDSEVYFIPNPNNALDKITDIIEKYVSNDSKSKENFERSKALFLEKKTEEIFRNALPNSVLMKNSQWKNNHTDGENDLTILVENYAFVVEAKSNHARKNVKKGIVKEISSLKEDLISKTSEQANNFSGILRENIGKKIEFKTIGGDSNIFDLTNITNIIPLGIIFADIPVQSVKQLNTNKTISIPIISLYELIRIMQCLTLTSEKIDYLRKRHLIERSARYFGDEYDLLYTYLKCGFNTDKRLYENTKEDAVIMIEYTENSVTRGDLERTSFFDAILSDLEQKKPEEWLNKSLSICNIPPIVQKQIEREIKNSEKICLIDNLKFRKQGIIAKLIDRMTYEEKKEIELDIYQMKVSSIYEGIEISNIIYIGMNVENKCSFLEIYNV